MVVRLLAFWPASARRIWKRPAERALTAEEKAVADLANAYEAAFNQDDAKAVAEHFPTEDAEWVDAEGTGGFRARRRSKRP